MIGKYKYMYNHLAYDEVQLKSEQHILVFIVDQSRITITPSIVSNIFNARMRVF